MWQQQGNKAKAKQKSQLRTGQLKSYSRWDLNARQTLLSRRANWATRATQLVGVRIYNTTQQTTVLYGTVYILSLVHSYIDGAVVVLSKWEWDGKINLVWNAIKTWLKYSSIDSCSFYPSHISCTLIENLLKYKIHTICRHWCLIRNIWRANSKVCHAHASAYTNTFKFNAHHCHYIITIAILRQLGRLVLLTK